MNGSEVKRLEEQIFAVDRHLTSEIIGLRRETTAAAQGAKEAVDKAEVAAKETLRSHNDLIRQSRDRDATYATRELVDKFEETMLERLRRIESFQAKLIGGMLLLAFLGAANLVKIWTG